MAPTIHARFSPSRAHRDLECAGAAAMEDGIPNEGSEFAAWGTACHALSEVCLVQKTEPDAYLGQTFEGVRVDEEMVETAATYVRSIREYATGNELMVEVRVPIGHITGEEGAEGTTDALIFTSDGEEVQVHDLKGGRGVAVSAESNPQGQLYALGALELATLYGFEPKRVRIVIHQPRVSNAPSEWDCTVEELVAFGEQAKEQYKLCRFAFEHRGNWLNGPDYSYLKAGEKQCKFCRAKATCPKLAAMVQEAVGADFSEISEYEASDLNVGSYTDADLATKRKAVPLIEDWCKAVSAEAERRLLAGQPVPGFKLVEGRRGARKWKDEKEAEAMLKRMRLKQEEMYDFSLISPTTAEKLHKAGTIGPRQWPQVVEAITQSEGKPSVAPESDKRPALVITPVADDFAPVDEAIDDLV